MNSVRYFEIQSDNPKRDIQFYSDIFNWKFTRDPNIPIEYWRIETEGMYGGLLERPTKIPPPQSGTNAFVCSMQVENFDKTAEKIIASGGQVALEKFAVPGKCWQGYFIDLAGNTFGIFQVDEDAG